MRDSRIGSYGGIALVLSLSLRIGALATLLDRTGAVSAAVALVLAASLSRVAALAPMVLLAPARPGGASASVGRPSKGTVGIAAGIGLVLALLALPFGLPLAGLVLMPVLALTASLTLSGIAHAKIGGQTGDVIGACQQVAEIAALLGLILVVPM
jgi:adenosylcobinamide-GDP ribazoletransferase